MSDAAGARRELSIDDLAGVRERTEQVAALLRARLDGHLEALRPVLSPRRLLGRHVRGGVREDAQGADRALAELRERYAGVAGRPFNLPKELPDEPLGVEPIAELHPFDYEHKLDSSDRAVTMTSPVRWLLGFRSGYTPAELRHAVRERASLRSVDARQFIVNALVLHALLERFPEISALLTDLRYDVRSEKIDGLGELPLTTIRIASLESFRPSDSVIATATRFSGVPAFIELIDFDAARTMADPLREQVETGRS
ncbi:MAG: hypothetical protein WEF50_18275 [Myxococcota bacterium]